MNQFDSATNPQIQERGCPRPRVSFMILRICRTRASGLLALVTASTLMGADQELKEWENPKLTGLNNQPPHATMIICPDAKTAQSIRLVDNSERTKSSFYRSLNGDWKYHYATNHAGRVADFWKPEFDDHNWQTIPVPSNVEMFGYGIPIYVNIEYP